MKQSNTPNIKDSTNLPQIGRNYRSLSLKQSPKTKSADIMPMNKRDSYL